MNSEHPLKPARNSPRVNDDDFIAQLLEILDGCTGGLEEQLARQIETQMRERFGGTDVYIQRTSDQLIDQRNRQICESRCRGLSIRQLVSVYRLGETTIRRICRGA